MSRHPSSVASTGAALPGDAFGGLPVVARWAAVLLLAVLSVGIGVWAQAPAAVITAVALLATIGTLAAAIDMAEHRLPDRLTMPLAVSAVGAAAVHSVVTTSPAPLAQTVGGVALVFVVMALLVILGSGIGGGDLKFSAAAAGAPALVGGVTAAGLGLAVGLLLVGVVALVARRRGHEAVVFGPGLFAGALLVALAGLIGP